MASPTIYITTYTWSKDSHGLFDYDEKRVITHNFRHSEKALLCRDYENNVSCSNDIPYGAEVLTNIERLGEDFIFNTFKGGEEAWLVVKSLKSKMYQISEGDLIRLGRMVLIVRKID
jgi:hypothetical protein